MKKSNILSLLLCLLLIPPLQSCGEEDKEWLDSLIQADFITIGNIVIIEGDAFYVLMDNGKTLYPGDISKLNYKPQDGERVFVYFNQMKEKVAGYTFTIEIIAMDKLTIEKIVLLTKANAEEIGNDPVTIDEIWVGGGFINIRYKYYGKTEHTQKHAFNLIINEATEQEDEYFFELEFRHNSMNDSHKQWQEGIIAYKMNTELIDLSSRKELHIRVQTNLEGEKVIVLDLSQGNIVTPQKYLYPIE